MPWRDLVLLPLWERRARTLLAILGIACGTALYVAIEIIDAATLEHFRASIESVAGTSTFGVVGPATGFAEETLERVEAVPGVDRVVPMVQARARAGARREEAVTVLGVDLLREPAVRAYRGEDDVLDDPLELLNQADSVLVTHPFAEEHRLGLGGALVLTTPSGPQTFVVRGILAPKGAAQAFGGRVVFMDIDAARVAFGKEGRTDRLDVVAKKGTVAEDVAKATVAAIGPGLRVERVSEEGAALQKMIASYQEVLSGLARLALVVAVFLVGSTMGVAVAERRKEIGVLRAIGATRATIGLVFLATAALLGVAGSLLGLPLGRALASIMVGAVSRSVSLACATPIDVTTLHFPARVAALAVSAGALAALVGGLAPALCASRIPCIEALRPKDAGDPPPGHRPGWTVYAGILVLAYVAIGSMLEIDWRSPLLHDSTLTIAYVGGALVAPWLSTQILAGLCAVVARTPIARIRPVGLALASLASTARRATGATSLVAALVLVLLMSATHASFSRTLSRSTAKMLAADVWVSESGLFLNGESAPLVPEIGAEIARVEGVDGAVYGQRSVKIAHEGRIVALKAWDRAPLERAPIVTTDGSGPSAVRAMFEDDHVVLVSEAFATRFAKRRGDVVVLETPAGRATFRIAGIVLDVVWPEGTIYTSRETYRALFHDDTLTLFYAYVRAGEPPAAVRDRIDAALGERRGVVATVTEDVRSLSLRVLDDAFAYTGAIEAAALVVGLLGLLGTMLVALLERKRELGVLRAIGATRAQVGAMILVEAALTAAASSLAALVLGAYLARVWLGGALAHDVGWPITVEVPALSVASTMAAGVVAGLLVGLLGARRASTVPLREALAYE